MNINFESIGNLLRQHKNPDGLIMDEWKLYLELANGDHQAAFVLRRVIYWHSTTTVQQRKTKDFWKTHEQMQQETGLTKHLIKKAQGNLSHIVQVTLRRREGKQKTYYKLKVRALLRKIGAVLSRYTGKTIELVGEKRLPSLHNRFNDSTSKPLTRHTHTSYLISSYSDNQTQTSINQDTNQKPATAPPAQPIDDDLMLNLPDQFKKYSFTGECDVAALQKHINRIGEKQVIATIEHCISKGGKSWRYVLIALKNVNSASVMPASSANTVYGIGMQAPVKDTGQWIPGGNDKYAEFIKR